MAKSGKSYYLFLFLYLFLPPSYYYWVSPPSSPSTSLFYYIIISSIYLMTLRISFFLELFFFEPYLRRSAFSTKCLCASNPNYCDYNEEIIFLLNKCHTSIVSYLVMLSKHYSTNEAVVYKIASSFDNPYVSIISPITLLAVS